MRLRLRFLAIASGICALGSAAACASFGTATSDDAPPPDATTNDSSALDGEAPDVGPDAADPSDASPGPRKRVFATKDGMPSTFSNGEPPLAIADDICNQAAEADSGTFHAWFSDGSVNASARGIMGPYWNWSQTAPVFASTGDVSVASSSSVTLANLTAPGGLPPFSEWWTGMSTSTAIGFSCADWTNLGNGTGAVGGGSNQWYGGGLLSCAAGNVAGFLCFER